ERTLQCVYRSSSWFQMMAQAFRPPVCWCLKNPESGVGLPVFSEEDEADHVRSGMGADRHSKRMQGDAPYRIAGFNLLLEHQRFLFAVAMGDEDILAFRTVDTLLEI